MTEAAGDQPERKKPAKMAVGMGKKAVGETLRTPEVISPEQRIVDFVKQVAVFEDGETRDIAKSAVLTNMEGLPGIKLHAQILGEELDGRTYEPMYVLRVVYPDGCIDAMDVEEGGRLTYAFGHDGGTYDDLDDDECNATVTSFFVRYRLDEYAKQPELWRPETHR